MFLGKKMMKVMIRKKLDLKMTYSVNMKNQKPNRRKIFSLRLMAMMKLYVKTQLKKSLHLPKESKQNIIHKITTKKKTWKFKDPKAKLFLFIKELKKNLFEKIMQIK